MWRGGRFYVTALCGVAPCAWGHAQKIPTWGPFRSGRPVRVGTRPCAWSDIMTIPRSTRARGDTPARVGVYQASIRVAPYARGRALSERPRQGDGPNGRLLPNLSAPTGVETATSRCLDGDGPLLRTAPGIGLQNHLLLVFFCWPSRCPRCDPPPGAGTRGDPCRAGRKTRRSDGSWQHALPSAHSADGRVPPQLSSRLFRIQNSAVARATLSRRRPRWSAMSDSFRACRHERAGRSAAPT